MAEQAGQDVAQYVSDLVARAASISPANGGNGSTTSAREFDRALDELFAADTRKLPSLPLTYSRQDIYADRD